MPRSTPPAPTTPKGRSKRSKAASLAAEVNAIIGKDVLTLGNDGRYTVRFLPTGVLPIDVLLGGGFARNRITELYGDWSTLKSWLVLKACARTQQDGGVAAIIDTEHAYDSAWAEMVGCVTEDLIVIHPESGEEAYDVTDALVRSGKVDLIAWDSVAATLPRDEAEHMESGDKSVQPGRLAALMSRGLRKVTTGNKDVAIVFTNQTRMSIGVKYGNPETTPGGKSLPFFASVRLNLRKAGTHHEEKTVGGKRVRTTVAQDIKANLAKSRVSAPHRDVTFTYDFRIPGVDEAEWLFRHGLAEGLIIQRGASYDFDGYTYKGKAAIQEAIREDDPTRAALVAQVVETL